MKLIKLNVNYRLVLDISFPELYNEELKCLIRYWTDGAKVFCGIDELKSADVESFTVFNNTFAKDKKGCYLRRKRLQGADPETFVALNLCYAKDKNSVWTTGGKLKDVDSATFEVCDDGFSKPLKTKEYVLNNGEKREIINYIPYGYAKDANNVYYENFQGKAKVVKKADPKTFVSLNDGMYGYDKNFVFEGQFVIHKANPTTWKPICFDKSPLHSMDDRFVFYGNKIIKNADVNTFQLFEFPNSDGSYTFYYGKDKNNYFNKLEACSVEQIHKELNTIF